MKREILFRGKRMDGRGWVEGDLLTNYVHHTGWTIVQGGCINTEVHPGSVGQFTGLRDKTGRRIFEGDVVNEGDGACDVISFQSGCFKTNGGIISSTAWEIQGNIHDNPELLQ